MENKNNADNQKIVQKQQQHRPKDWNPSPDAPKTAEEHFRRTKGDKYDAWTAEITDALQRKNAPVQRAADDEKAPPKHPRGGFYVDEQYIGMIFLDSEEDELTYNGQKLRRWTDTVFTYYDASTQILYKYTRKLDGSGYDTEQIEMQGLKSYTVAEGVLNHIHSMNDALEGWGSSFEEVPWYAALLRDLLLAPYSAVRTIFWDRKDIFGKVREGWDYWMSFLDLPGAGAAMKMLGSVGKGILRMLGKADEAEDAAKALNAADKALEGADDLTKNADDLAKNADEGGKGKKIDEGGTPTKVLKSPVEYLASFGITVKPINERLLKFVGDIVTDDTTFRMKNGWLRGTVEITDETLRNKGITTNMFKVAFEYFQGLKGVEGVWIKSGKLTDNYDAFVAAYQATKNAEKAAFSTPTGKILEKMGYTKVTVEFVEESGKIGDIKAFFPIQQ